VVIKTKIISIDDKICDLNTNWSGEKAKLNNKLSQNGNATLQPIWPLLRR
jgi:hypothetical protein